MAARQLRPVAPHSPRSPFFGSRLHFFCVCVCSLSEKMSFFSDASGAKLLEDRDLLKQLTKHPEHRAMSRFLSRETQRLTRLAKRKRDE